MNIYAFDKEEPYESGGSLTVLWERRGETPIHSCFVPLFPPLMAHYHPFIDNHWVPRTAWANFDAAKHALATVAYRKHEKLLPMTKTNYFGVGPKIGRIVLPWLAAAVALTLLFPSGFTFGATLKPYMLVAGLLLLVPGLILYFISGRMLVDGVKKGRLITTGPYRYCRNPLYAMLILGVIPGVGLVMNSWLMLTVPVVGYLAFRRCIAGEYSEMEQAFGEEFRSYSKATPEFFPWFPKR